MSIQPPFRVPPGSVWARRLTEPGWLLLPLRAFLGLTFCYAGLQKLANPAYLDPNSPTSAAGQMRLLQHSSPIGPLLSATVHAPVLVGLVIAVGELAVGVGTLFGLFGRIAAAGGVALSLSFFLTVSWGTTPYYYGSDIVFTFAWLTMFAFGTGGVLSLDTWAAERARASLRAKPGRVPPRMQAELDRRTLLRRGSCAALVGTAAAVTGGLTAAIGRALGRTSRHPAAAPVGNPAPPAHRTREAGKPSAAATANGTAIAAVADVPVGQARPFTDPATGYPGWVVHESASSFVAFSAVCTHAGCPVQYDSSAVQFVCPCHGGVFDARTGHVLGGPPFAPLPKIPVQVVGSELTVRA